MSSITLDIREDVSHREGGHAIILIKGLKTKPDNGAFAIEPADASLAARDLKGWPVGIRRPLKTTMSNSGFEIVVGPDVVECPVLLPGTPVVIKVPAAGVCEEALWPDITPLRRQKVKRIITSSERRDALARAQSNVTSPADVTSSASVTSSANVTSLEVALAKPAMAGSTTQVPADGAGAGLITSDAQVTLAQNLAAAHAPAKDQLQAPAGVQDISQRQSSMLGAGGHAATIAAMQQRPSNETGGEQVGSGEPVSAVEKLISGTTAVPTTATTSSENSTAGATIAAAATLAISASTTQSAIQAPSNETGGSVTGSTIDQTGGVHPGARGSETSEAAGVKPERGSVADRQAADTSADKTSGDTLNTGSLSKLSGYSKVQPAVPRTPSGNDNHTPGKALNAIGQTSAAATQSTAASSSPISSSPVSSSPASTKQKEDMLVAALASTSTAIPKTSVAKQAVSAPISQSGKAPATSNAPGLPQQPLNQSKAVAAPKSSRPGGVSLQNNPAVKSKLVQPSKSAPQKAPGAKTPASSSSTAAPVFSPPSDSGPGVSAVTAVGTSPSTTLSTTPATTPSTTPAEQKQTQIQPAPGATGGSSQIAATTANMAISPTTAAQPQTKHPPQAQPSISHLADRLSSEPKAGTESDAHDDGDQPVPQVRNLRAERPSRRWYNDGWMSGMASGVFASMILLYTYVSVAGWPNLTTIGLPPASATGFVSQHGEGLAIYDALKVGTVSPRGIFASTVNADAAIKRADNSLRVSSTGGSRDTDESAFWFKHYLSNQIGAKRTTWALTQLGTTYANPSDGTPDFKKAQVLWEAAAALGDPYAACFLGQLYEHGLGVVMSRDLALTWYLRARSAGGCSSLNKSIARLGG